MRRLTTIGVAAIAVLVLGAMTATTSFALPTLKPNEKAIVIKTEKGSQTELQTLGASVKVTCETQKSESEFPAKSVLGPFHISFEKCKGEIGGISAGTCTGSGDASGTILSLGEAHLVYDSLTVLGAAVLFLVNETSFECKSIVTLKAVVKGSVLCLITPINSSANPHTLKCEEEKGDPKETTYWNDAGVAQTTLLLTSENGGAFKDSAEGGEASLKSFIAGKEEKIEIIA
jgi:hypothetical protein